jgi:hypothetical protein
MAEVSRRPMMSAQFVATTADESVISVIETWASDS